MKNIILGIVAVIILGGILHQFMPWWSIALAAGIVGLIFSKKTDSSFIYGFVGAMLLWFGMSYYLDNLNNSILSNRMGEIFNGIGTVGMLAITAFIAGLLGGMGAMTGTLGRKMLEDGRR